jgi:broad specificity phosphatase PhoE
VSGGSGPTGLVTVFLVRHGQTELNAGGVLRGRLDPPLNATGQREAEALARALQHLQATLIVSSPLRRALETGSSIARACGAAIEVDGRLVDRDYGRFAGQAREEVERRYGSLDEAPGVEPAAAVLSRAAAALDAVAERIADGTAVVVAHDVVNRLLLSAYDPARHPRADDIPQRTGCYNLLQRSGTRWVVGGVDLHPASGLAG